MNPVPSLVKPAWSVHSLPVLWHVAGTEGTTDTTTRRFVTPLLFGLLACLALVLGASSARAQEPRRITDLSLTSTGSVRLVTEPTATNPELLLLESSGSPLGPWWKEAESRRTTAPNGYEFVTPRKAYNMERYYRIGAFGEATLPFIRFISPNSDVRPGLSVTLLGANFDPTPAGNTVQFELPNQSWTAVVTEAASNYLAVAVPTNLLAPPETITGLLYRVTVATSQGTGNGVGCLVYPTPGKAFALRPAQSYIIQTPGAGIATETLVVGGGIPPYRLVPQTPTDQAKVLAQLNGPVVQLTASTGVTSGSFTIEVEDSSVPPQRAGSSVGVVGGNFAFNPTLTGAFHTLLAGSAPGLTMTARFNALRPEQLEMRLQNAQIELDQLEPGFILGLLKLYYSSSIYGYQHLVVTEVSAGRAKFDIVSLEGGGVTTAAQGELIQNPPAIVIQAIGQKAASLMGTTVDEEFTLSDSIFRLPAGVGQNFTLTTLFTSVSSREDRYLPRQQTVTQQFTTTGVTAGAPRLERLLPVQGEVNRNVRVQGTGFDPNPTNNLVTFAGPEGTRVPAEIVLQTNDEIVVTVPPGAISGPVRLEVGGKTSNDFSFFVRFHPEATLIFSSFTNDTPTAPRFIHQQPVDEDETVGEVPLQRITATLDQGRLVMTGVSSNMQVGTAANLNFYVGQQSDFLIMYMGQEPQTPQRHRFEVVGSPGSTTIFARLYALDDPDGNGVTFQAEGGDGIFQFNAGGMWDYQFTSSIFRPPAAAGTDVAVRLEFVSQQWTSIPGSEMRLIQNYNQRVK